MPFTKEIFSLINSRRDLLISRTILYLNVIAYAIIITSVIVSLFLLFYKGLYLSKTVRTIIISYSLLPILIFLFSISTYERILPNTPFNYRSLFNLSLLLLYIILPSLIILNRYENVIGNSIAAFNLLILISTIISPFISPFFKNKKINISKFVSDTTIYFWSNNNYLINPSFFENINIYHDRYREYFDQKNLEIFQTSFLNASREHIVLSNAVKNNGLLNNDIKLNLLDIGGHNGLFTTKLISNIDISLKKITMIDPIKNIEYQSNLEAFCSQIEIHQQKIEDFLSNHPSKYELVLASHSLYSYLDQDEKNFSALANTLIDSLSDNGLLIIILGSKESPAYNLKNDIIELLLNEKKNDTDLEKYQTHFSGRNDIHSKTYMIDNYIDIDQLILNDDILSGWVAYFTRTPIIKDKILLDQVKKLFHLYSSKSFHYPKCSEIFDLTGSTKYMLHKTKALLVWKK